MAFRMRTAAIAAFISLMFLALSGAFGTDGAAAARYVVAQCGWHVGQDADWYDTSADKFMKSTYCQTPASADPFDGVHLLSQVKGSAGTVGGTRFSTWRWQAPAGTGIVNVHGQRWQYLRNGFEHRLGGVAAGGGFSPFLSLDTSDGTKRDFGQGFSPYAQAFESRLVCYRQQDDLCQVNGTIQAAVRSLTISIDDPSRPTAQVSGPLTGTGWLRGTQTLSFTGKDVGSGLRFAETSVDGSVRARTELSCAKEMVSGQWRGTRMQPCSTTSAGTHSIDTRTLADGPHVLRHCAVDFATATGCSTDRTIRVDNNAPAAPRDLTVTGGEGWHRTNDFDLTWSEPGQGAASPVRASLHLITGKDGYQAGPWVRGESGRVDDITVPGAGEYRVEVWLADEAGNQDRSHSAGATLLLDDVPPTGYFLDPPADDPALIRVPVSDVHSGVTGGQIAWRPVAGGDWQVIPGTFDAGDEPTLSARIPSAAPRGIWELRAVVVDRAGNIAAVDSRANGSKFTVETPFEEDTKIVAGFQDRGVGTGSRIEVGYGQRAYLAGRLTRGQDGVGDQELTVIEEPMPGSRQGITRRTVRTDARGDFGTWIEPGPGRRVKVSFAGTRRLGASTSGTLEMRVAGRLLFSARPKRLRTGKRVRFRGRVLARDAWHPRRGNIVQIQYFEESARRWRPVAIARTARDGRYRSGYRFRYITGVARIKLRAVLLPSPRFPYGGAASKPVVIRVRG